MHCINQSRFNCDLFFQELRGTDYLPTFNEDAFDNHMRPHSIVPLIRMSKDLRAINQEVEVTVRNTG